MDPDTHAIKSKPIIIKLGGSNISRNRQIVDFSYLREFRDMIKDNVALGKRFVIIVGGGEKCREYINYAKEEGNIENLEDLHWIGTAYNTINAYIVRGFFGDSFTEKKVWKFDDVRNLAEQKFTQPVVIAGGFEAGKSSDWCALQIAKVYQADKVIDLKNVAGVYDKDPKKNANAKLIEEMTWSEYQGIINNKKTHDPGGNLPVDPVAANEANEQNIRYDIIKGDNFANIESSINNEKFTGTIIQNN